MAFRPPCCPNPACHQHCRPEPGFYRPHGEYRVRCRPDPVPRFRCLSCRRTFSRQTFRHDYRDHRPDCNELLLQLLYSGVGLRQSARVLELGVHAVQRKFRKIAATCAALHTMLSPRLPSGRTFLLDEEESYEGASIRPLTVPIVIERESRFVVATGVGKIRRLAPPGTRRRQRQDDEERKHGTRPDLGRQTVRLALECLRERLGDGDFVMQTDEKTSYGPLLRAVFGHRGDHGTTNSKRPRTTRNPLFPINHTIAMTRDNNGRLRRHTWLVSQRGPFLAAQLTIFVIYRNYIRKRFNRDRRGWTPAVALGLLDRPLREADVVGWRHPLGLDPTTLDKADRGSMASRPPIRATQPTRQPPPDEPLASYPGFN